MTLRRNSLSSYDYPEHLNPFSAEHEENKKNKYFTFGRHRASFKESAVNAWNIITTPTRRHRSNSLSSTSRQSYLDPISIPSSTPRTVSPSTPSTSRTPTCSVTSPQSRQNTGESPCSQSDEEKRYVRQGARPKKKRRAPLPPGPNPATCQQESKKPFAVGISSSAETLNEPEISLRTCLATTTLIHDVPKVCITYSSSDESAATAPLAHEDECDLNPNTDVSGNEDQPVSTGKKSEGRDKQLESVTGNMKGSSEISNMALKELINDIITAYPPEDSEDKLEMNTFSNQHSPAPSIEYVMNPKQYVNTTTIPENIDDVDIPTPKIKCEESNYEVTTTCIEEDSSVENIRAALQVKEDDCIHESNKSEETPVSSKVNLPPLRIDEPNEKCDIIENSLLAISATSSTNNVCLRGNLETLEKKPTSNSKLHGFRIEDHSNTLSSMKTDNTTSYTSTIPVSSKTCEDKTNTEHVTEGMLSTAEQNGYIANGCIKDHNNKRSSMTTVVKISSTRRLPVSNGTCENYPKDNVRTGSVPGGVFPTAEQNGCIANGSVGSDQESEEDLGSISPVPPPRFRPHPTPRLKRAMLEKVENK